MRKLFDKSLFFVVAVMYVFTICLFNNDVYAAGKVTSIVANQEYSDSDERMVVEAKDSAGKIVWSYKTNYGGPCTELSRTACFVKKGMVYIFSADDGLVVLNKQTGKQIFKLTDDRIKIASVAMTVDSKKNIYVIGYYSNKIVCVNAKGKIYNTITMGDECWWPYKIKVKGSHIKVYMENGDDPCIVTYTKTGKVVSTVSIVRTW